MNRPLFWGILTVISLSQGIASLHAEEGFQISHRKGRVVLPTRNPFDASGPLIRWKDQCGNSDRLCAEAFVRGERIYLLGGTLSPDEAKKAIQCEPGASLDPKLQSCTKSTQGFFTWTRKFNSVVLAFSADAQSLDTKALARWLEQVRWEEK